MIGLLVNIRKVGISTRKLTRDSARSNPLKRV